MANPGGKSTKYMEKKGQNAAKRETIASPDMKAFEAEDEMCY